MTPHFVQNEIATAERARRIIASSKMEQHAHLDAHGFGSEMALVWRPDEQNNLLVVPAYRNGALVGCQLINRQGAKKMSRGMYSFGACYTWDNAGQSIFCDDYITGLAVKKCLDCIKAKYKIHVCFTPENTGEMAGIAGMVVGKTNLWRVCNKFDVGNYESFLHMYRSAGIYNAAAKLSAFMRHNTACHVDAEVMQLGGAIVPLWGVLGDLDEMGHGDSAAAAGVREMLENYRLRIVKNIENQVM